MTALPAVTHRSASARPVAAVVWLFAVGTLVWLLVAGATSAAIHAAPWLGLLSWCVYTSQWRPCLRVDGSGFGVINGLRDHQIPFGTVRDIEVSYTTAIWAAGKKYVSWGAPTPPSAFGSGFQNVRDLKTRPYTMLPSNERISQPEMKTGRDAIVAAWQDARHAGFASTSEVVVSTWNWPVIVVGVPVIFSVIASAIV
ncbi:hypothetical protein C8D78_0538 [Arthrobacter oryzae]|uniref:PH domain-containing protein n=1 Tax=Arthrobacter oryzae TaxID=409290 RepID=A0A495FPA7_9MICC|nr:hypothetical protein C8D78_0538 [Arthrobacter oryzae]